MITESNDTRELVTRLTASVLTRAVVVGVLIVLFTLSVGCGGASQEEANQEEAKLEALMPDADPAFSTNIRGHYLQYIGGTGEEAEGYGMYTYALLNYAGSDQLSSQAQTQYITLLEAVSKTDTIPSDIEDDEKRLHNLFIAPYSVSNGFSRDIIRAIKISSDDGELLTRLSSNQGPFLVSTIRPIAAYMSLPEDSTMHVLFADLTRTHPAAMEEVVRRYKIRLIDQAEWNGPERFKSLELDALNAVLQGNAYVVLIQTTAIRFLKPIFGGG